MFKKEDYKKAVYVTYVMEWMAKRASKGKKNWLDKIILKVLAKALSTQKDNVDFMQDDLIDAEYEFDIEELEAFEKGQNH